MSLCANGLISYTGLFSFAFGVTIGVIGGKGERERASDGWDHGWWGLETEYGPLHFLAQSCEAFAERAKKIRSVCLFS